MQNDKYFLTFCDNLRQLRNAHGLSQKKMAGILGIGVKSLTLLENNIMPPRLGCEMLFHASRYFNIRAYELFLPMETPGKTEPPGR